MSKASMINQPITFKDRTLLQLSRSAEQDKRSVRLNKLTKLSNVRRFMRTKFRIGNLLLFCFYFNQSEKGINNFIVCNVKCKTIVEKLLMYNVVWIAHSAHVLLGCPPCSTNKLPQWDAALIIIMKPWQRISFTLTFKFLYIYSW